MCDRERKPATTNNVAGPIMLTVLACWLFWLVDCFGLLAVCAPLFCQESLRGETEALGAVCMAAASANPAVGCRMQPLKYVTTGCTADADAPLAVCGWVSPTALGERCGSVVSFEQSKADTVYRDCLCNTNVCLLLQASSHAIQLQRSSSSSGQLLRWLRVEVLSNCCLTVGFAQ